MTITATDMKHIFFIWQIKTNFKKEANQNQVNAIYFFFLYTNILFLKTYVHSIVRH